MKLSRLSGFNVIENENFTVYGYFKDNVLEGKAILRSPDTVQAGEYSKGKKTRTISSTAFKHETFLNILIEWFPKETIGIIDFLSHLASAVEAQDGITFREIRMQQNYKFYGFLGGPSGVDNRQHKEGLGIKFKNECLLSCGWHVGTDLDGLGRLYCVNGELHDGVFYKGRLDGFGVKYSKSAEKYTVGEHENNKICYGFGYPRKEIAAIRRELHLRSVHFMNAYVIFSKLIHIDLNSMIANERK